MHSFTQSFNSHTGWLCDHDEIERITTESVFSSRNQNLGTSHESCVKNEIQNTDVSTDSSGSNESLTEHILNECIDTEDTSNATRAFSSRADTCKSPV